VLANHFNGASPTWADGDFNFDGKVNALDFNAVASNFGKTVSLGSPALGSLVPEPSMALALIASTGISARSQDQSEGIPVPGRSQSVPHHDSKAAAPCTDRGCGAYRKDSRPQRVRFGGGPAPAVICSDCGIGSGCGTHAGLALRAPIQHCGNRKATRQIPKRSCSWPVSIACSTQATYWCSLKGESS